MRSRVLLSMVALVCAVTGCRHSDSALPGRLGGVLRRTELLAALRVDLLSSAGAEKSAVMAMTDSASHRYAEESRQAAARVERGRLTLDSLMATEATQHELALSQAFDSCWTELRTVDAQILSDAVQNTTLKAQALSWGQGQEAADRFVQALEPLVGATGPGGGRATPLAARALVAELQVQALLAPHIAEASDEKMDAMERRMAALTHTVDRSLAALGRVLPPGSRSLREARAAHAEFTRTAAEIVRLSRQNTNVRSLAMSLGIKRRLAARCDEVLSALYDEVGNTPFLATR